MKGFLLVILLLAVFTVDGHAAYCLSAAKGYKTSLMIKRYLTDLADNSSGFAVIVAIGSAKGTNEAVSSEKEITGILISENASWADKRKPTIVITGAIHGNEWASPEVCLGIAEYLLTNKDNGRPARDDKGTRINEEAPGLAASTALAPRITSIKELLKTVQVLIIPVLNPAGYDYSHTPPGRRSYYGTGWRPNRRTRGLSGRTERVCYKKDGNRYAIPPADAEHCFLADYDATAKGGDLEEEEVVVCETADGRAVHLFEPSLRVASAEMFDAVYNSTEPLRVVCASNQRRVWQEQWSTDGTNSMDIAKIRNGGYLQEAVGVDLNRNFQYKWDVTQDQKALFIRSRSPSSRMYRGTDAISEKETSAMEQVIAAKNVVALIDYHSGSTQVLYPYAYSTRDRVSGSFLGDKSGSGDYEVFRLVSEKIVSLLNRHDRGDESIVNFTAAQNYNNNSVGSGVARDCYYRNEKIAAINIEVHTGHYTYQDEEFRKVVPEICKTNVPGAVWFMFWAAELESKQAP